MADSSNSKFPSEAEVVIVGVGGIVGSMLAYWLAELGQKNIVGLEKSTIIPSDIASTAHASDFVYNTTHDKLGCWTTAYSRKFYEDNGFFLKKGGLEICRVGDDERWEELKRKVASGKAFGTNVSLISAAEAVEKFPLLEEESMIGAMWDPDAGLVVPRSQEVVNFAVESAKEKGALKTFTNTPATDFEVENGKIVGVKTDKGTIKTNKVVIASGIWGPLMGDKAGVGVPLMPVEHPLLFFGPYEEIQDTEEMLVHPLLRDQGNSAYVRDTGKFHGGMLEWGYYEDKNPRLVDPEDIGNPDKTMLSDSMRYLELEEIAEPLGADFHIGLDEKDFYRVSDVIYPTEDIRDQMIERARSLVKLGITDDVAVKTLQNPRNNEDNVNSKWWRKAEIPAANGHGNARSVATIQGLITNDGEINGVQLLKTETIDLIFQEQSNGLDLVFLMPLRFGIGYALPNEEFSFLPQDRRVCFWGGNGGSIIVNDVDENVTISYIMNKMIATPTVGDARGIGIIEAAYKALESINSAPC